MTLSRFICAGICAFVTTVAAGYGAGEVSETEEGFYALFNGHDLAGWEGDTKGYVVEDGMIVCKPGGKLYTAEDFADFDLRFEFKLTPGANNGLGIRMAPDAHAAYDAMELQILDNTAEKYKDLHPYQYHGSIYGVVPAKRGHLKPVGEWNEEEVVADGDHITVRLNGVVIVDADIREASENGTMDGKDHPGLLRPSGRIGFLGHGDVLYFRNIRIKRLNGAKSSHESAREDDVIAYRAGSQIVAAM